MMRARGSEQHKSDHDHWANEFEGAYSVIEGISWENDMHLPAEQHGP